MMPAFDVEVQVSRFWSKALQSGRMLRALRGSAFALLAIFSGTVAVRADTNFESKVAPLLIKRCVECHQGREPAGGLSLTTQAGLKNGGDSGAVIDPENADESHLLQRVVAGEMPPEQQGRAEKLSETEIRILQNWLRSGAVWPDERELDFFERTNDQRAGRDWWSLQPIIKPPVPQLQKHPQPENPIDAFILARLEAEGFSPAPSADRRTLIRRVYFDLIGLPPSLREVDDFLEDNSSTAWERLVDRLLATPQYGERWGRYWLDLARYADTSGYERDQEKLFAWRYRDWVVNAFNSDMPYRQFITEQLAGDEISERNEQSVIATGFLRLGAWNDEPNDPADYHYERLEDLVHTTSSAFLALTVKCARCHAHKFDAIKQEDYYRMATAFWPGLETGGKREQLGGPTAEILGFPNVLGWTDLDARPAPLYLLKDGERLQPMEEVIPATLSSIPSLERHFLPPESTSRTTGRRLQLAQWIADPEHPLAPRVLVNRLWLHHFGQAIVRTPNNFGFLADPPTHPRLLDWLAAEFVANGGRMKAIHRLILTSSTWQQSSLPPNARELEKRDPANRWHGRANRRRHDAETLRDSLLASSGELDLTRGGPGFKPTISSNALEGLSRKSKAWQASAPHEQKRRSLYLYLKRGLLPPMMTTFDLCDPTQSCGKRDITTVPTQALALLNNRFVHDRSQNLASRITKQASDVDTQIGLAWTHVLSRKPSDHEFKLSRRHLLTQQRIYSVSHDQQSNNDLHSQLLANDLVLHLQANQANVSKSSNSQVAKWEDLSAAAHHAHQAAANAQPVLVENGFGKYPIVKFDGTNDFLRLDGQLLDSTTFTIIGVVNDEKDRGHREILSNWNGAKGNATSSLFLGLTETNTVRFTDRLPNFGVVTARREPFILSAVSRSDEVEMFQNGRLLSTGPALSDRRLDTAWVIGQQGNINGEFWQGGIAELLVFRRALTSSERRQIERGLAERYQLPLTNAVRFTARSRAVASLCHVLMNSNEFIYID
ncbi:MAG: DUF1549 domain-containing protein [Pirellulaceae bacterium]|nr:DUF1549 domain-containing protein [Pirellulaceae bacterium]